MMKKFLAIIVTSLLSLNCMAGTHSRTIQIRNNTNNTIKVRDRDNHKVTVKAHKSASLSIIVHEPHGSLIPSSIMPHVTEITVSQGDNENSIKINEYTTKVTVNAGLELSEQGGGEPGFMGDE